MDFLQMVLMFSFPMPTSMVCYCCLSGRYDARQGTADQLVKESVKDHLQTETHLRSKVNSFFLADDEALYCVKQGQDKPCLKSHFSSSSKATEPWSTALPAREWNYGDMPPPPPGQVGVGEDLRDGSTARGGLLQGDASRERHFLTNRELAFICTFLFYPCWLVRLHQDLPCLSPRPGFTPPPTFSLFGYTHLLPQTGMSGAFDG